jgi:3-oxoacyl-[acyl-carrier-protein] synthase-3
MSKVYITRTSSFLPNTVVSNDEMEEYLGYVNGTKSKSKKFILRSNKIKERYYAITKDGKTTHTNSEMASIAIKKLFDNNPSEIKEVDLLCCGTSSPDQLMPSHGVMVHGWLPEMNAIEVLSPSGNCCTGMHSIKYAYMSLLTNEKSKAVCSGSERLSRIMRAEQFEGEIEHLSKLEKNPILAFEKDFLRWMLSDGAGAFLLEKEPNPDGLSLSIDWIELISFANQEEVCMYMGGEKMEGGELKGYSEYASNEIVEKSLFSIKQDTRLLGEKTTALGFVKLNKILKERNESIEDVDHFLVHMSSYFFEGQIAKTLEDNGIGIPMEKWFSNLSTKGNVGAGSIYLMIDELLKSGKAKKGEKVLLAVPESARFSYAFCLLTVC